MNKELIKIILAKCIILISVFAGIYTFPYWIVFPKLEILYGSSFWAKVPLICVALIASYLVWRWLKTPAEKLVIEAFYWAIAVGLIISCTLFYIPLILGIEGPMSEITITAPLGFFVGGICGLGFAFFKGTKKDNRR